MTTPVTPEFDQPDYSTQEEIAHAVTHGIGAVAGIVGLAVLVGFASRFGDMWHVLSCSIFGATLIILYTASTLYHSIPIPEAKRVLRVIDHASIYLLIAGSYTPYLLVTFRDSFGWPLFILVWGMAIVGVVFKIFFTGRFNRLSTLLYVGMGWVALLVIKPLIDGLPLGALVLMFAGGLAYTGGVVFYLWESLRYHHAIWHGFVLAGSVLHYLAVLFYVVPSGPI